MLEKSTSITMLDTWLLKYEVQRGAEREKLHLQNHSPLTIYLQTIITSTRTQTNIGTQHNW